MVIRRTFPWRLAACLLCGSVWWSCAGADEANAPLQVADLGVCDLTSGETLQPCRVAYRHYGPPLTSGQPVMVFPTWYSGATGDLESGGYIGQGRMADTSRFTVIAVGALGNGESESPSMHEGVERFPELSIADMVNSQHRLLTEVLDVDRLHTVLGVSLGGMQALEWAVRHPDFMDHVVAIEGTPWPSAWDRLSWGAMLSTMDAFDGSEASRQKTSRQLARLEAWLLWTPEWFHDMVAEDDLDDFLDQFDPDLTASAIHDHRAQLTAALRHDVGQGTEAGRAAAAQALNARTLIMVFERDQYVHPAPSQRFAEMADATLWTSSTLCGHMGPTTECQQAEIARVVNDFLSGTKD